MTGFEASSVERLLEVDGHVDQRKQDRYFAQWTDNSRERNAGADAKDDDGNQNLEIVENDRGWKRSEFRQRRSSARALTDPNRHSYRRCMHCPMGDSDTESNDQTTIRTGRNFEQEFRLDASEAGSFLIELGEQLRDGDDLTIETDEWELPFAFGDPVELEIEFEGVGDPTLEIELELPGRTDEKAPEVR